MTYAMVVKKVQRLQDLQKNFSDVAFVKHNSSFICLLSNCEQIVSGQVLLNQDDSLLR